jgi:hypothetical protein
MFYNKIHTVIQMRILLYVIKLFRLVIEDIQSMLVYSLQHKF